MLSVLEEGYFTLNGFINYSSFMTVTYAALYQLIPLCSRAIWLRYSFDFPSRRIVLRHYWVPLKNRQWYLLQIPQNIDQVPHMSWGHKCSPWYAHSSKSSFGLAIANTHLHKYHTDFLCFKNCIGKKKYVWLVT